MRLLALVIQESGYKGACEKAPIFFRVRIRI